MHKANKLCDNHEDGANLEETSASNCQYPLYSLMAMRDLAALIDTCADLLSTNSYKKAKEVIEVIERAKKNIRRIYNKM